MAQVVRHYLNADLDPWSVQFVSSYTNRSRPRQLVRLIAALKLMMFRPRRLTDGVHLHASEGFDLLRTTMLLEVARRRSVPAIVTIHGSEFMREVQRAPRLVRAMLRRASAVTVLSDEVQASALALGACSVELLSNPVELRPRATALTSRKQILFAGEIGRRKGVDVLLKAWPLVYTNHPDIELLLAGPLAESALVDSLPPGVRYAGPLPHAGVIQELEASRIAVLPSRAEAMPMFVLEAMASGVPVVTTPVGALAKILGNAGTLVEVDDHEALASAISELLTDSEKLEAMSQSGQGLVAAEFSTEVFTRKVVQLYTNVFGRP
jgi:glycosyltransferase involved in cell wall biosynthesis